MRILILFSFCFTLLTVTGHSLAETLAGIAEHQEANIAIYIAALELEKNVTTSAEAEKLGGNKRMNYLIVDQNYPVRNFVKHLAGTAAFGNNGHRIKAAESSLATIPTLKNSIQTSLNRRFLKQGDIFSIQLENGHTLLQINQQPLDDVADPQLFYYMLNSWLQNPVESFKQQLSGNNREKQPQLLETYSHYAMKPATLLAAKPVPAAQPLKAKPAIAATQPAAVKAKPVSTEIKPAAKTSITTPQALPAPTTASKPAEVKKPQVTQPATALALATPAPQPKTKAKPVPEREAERISNEAFAPRLTEILSQALKQQGKAPKQVQLYMTHQGQVVNVLSYEAEDKEAERGVQQQVLKTTMGLSPLPVCPAMEKPGVYLVEVAVQ